MKTLTPAAQAAKAIKAELKAAYPTVNFKVTSDNFAGGDAVRINYQDGPLTSAVSKITAKYQYGSFDSMQDMYEYTNRRTDIPQAKYINTQRDMSEAVRVELLAYTRSYYGIPDSVDYNDLFAPMGDYVCTLVRRFFYKKSYAEMVPPAGALYKIEIKSNHNSEAETRYYNELPKDVYFLEGDQNPDDAGKACMMVWDEGTCLTPLIDMATGLQYVKM